MIREDDGGVKYCMHNAACFGTTCRDAQILTSQCAENPSVGVGLEHPIDIAGPIGVEMTQHGLCLGLADGQ